MDICLFSASLPPTALGGSNHLHRAWHQKTVSTVPMIPMNVKTTIFTVRFAPRSQKLAVGISGLVFGNAFEGACCLAFDGGAEVELKSARRCNTGRKLRFPVEASGVMRVKRGSIVRSIIA